MKKTEQKTKKNQSDRTAFKLCVYYSHKPTGIPYTYIETGLKKNRKYHDSHDFILSGNGYVTRHDLALNKLLTHLEKHKDKITQALLFANDHVNKKQYLIGQFGKNEEFNRFIQPEFISYDNKNIFFNGLIAPPIEEFDLHYFNLVKSDPIKTNYKPI